jgi:hypothetical protein
MAIKRIKDLKTHPDVYVTPKQLAEKFDGLPSVREIQYLANKGAFEGVIRAGRKILIPTWSAKKFFGSTGDDK